MSKIVRAFSIDSDVAEAISNLSRDISVSAFVNEKLMLLLSAVGVDEMKVKLEYPSPCFLCSLEFKNEKLRRDFYDRG